MTTPESQPILPDRAVPMPHWPSIDTVFLDMDGTLLDLHFDNYFWKVHVPQRYAEQYRLSHAEAVARTLPHMHEIRGTLDWYNLHYWSEYLNMDIPALKREVRHLIRLRPSVMEFLTWLRETGKRTVLATNAHPDVIELKFSKVSLGPYFDRIVSSHELHSCKETPRFWQLLQRQMEYQAERSLLIDDNVHVLDAAHDFGIGWLLSIRQPDLMEPPQPATGYPELDDFHQIIPLH